MTSHHTRLIDTLGGHLSSDDVPFVPPRYFLSQIMNRKLKWLIRGLRRKQDSLIPMFAMYSGCLLVLGILLGRGSWATILGFVFAAAMWGFALVRLGRDVEKDIAEIKELRAELSRTLGK